MIFRTAFLSFSIFNLLFSQISRAIEFETQVGETKASVVVQSNRMGGDLKFVYKHENPNRRPNYYGINIGGYFDFIGATTYHLTRVNSALYIKVALPSLNPDREDFGPWVYIGRILPEAPDVVGDHRYYRIDFSLSIRAEWDNATPHLLWEPSYFEVVRIQKKIADDEAIVRWHREVSSSIPKLLGETLYIFGHEGDPQAFPGANSIFIPRMIAQDGTIAFVGRMLNNDIPITGLTTEGEVIDDFTFTLGETDSDAQRGKYFTLNGLSSDGKVVQVRGALGSHLLHFHHKNADGTILGGGVLCANAMAAAFQNSSRLTEQ